jgi:cyanophycin synthetase
VVRRWPGGAGLFLTTPLDGLLPATTINELAWDQAYTGTPTIDSDELARLDVHLRHDRNPRLVSLARAAAEHDVAFLGDDEAATVGMGGGCHTWPLHQLPDPSGIDWMPVHDIPVALITGSNGKTTTARLLAAILARTGKRVGLTSTDGITIAGEWVDRGDWAGPAGARRVLRDPGVDAAVLETARGGLLRRGVATTRAQVAVVTRVAPDHFGEYGIHDLDALADAKLIVTRVVPRGGSVVLNADDPALVRRAGSVRAPITWFSLDATSELIRSHCATGGLACVLEDSALVVRAGAERRVLARAPDLPITLRGAARYNIANALAAAAAAVSLSVPDAVIGETLRSFGADRGDNPGRLQLFEHNGATIVVDFVHNADGWYALNGALREVPAARRIVVLGQAGDRDDPALHDLAVAVCAGGPHEIVLKEMEEYLRGRLPGETTTVLADALIAHGVAPEHVHFTADEGAAVEMALALAQPGDLLVLAIHANYESVRKRLTV